jgi:hypothetical protein
MVDKAQYDQGSTDEWKKKEYDDEYEYRGHIIIPQCISFPRQLLGF